jgi:hypothetical protein
VHVQKQWFAPEFEWQHPTRVTFVLHYRIAGMEAKAAELPEISSFLKAISISGLLNSVFSCK